VIVGGTSPNSCQEKPRNKKTPRNRLELAKLEVPGRVGGRATKKGTKRASIKGGKFSSSTGDTFALQGWGNQR